MKTQITRKKKPAADNECQQCFHSLLAGTGNKAPIQITYRNWKHSDIGLVIKWKNDPILWELDDTAPFKQLAKIDIQEWFIANCVTNKHDFLILCDDIPIGGVGIKNITGPTGAFYIVIGERKFWGKGIGKKSMIWIENYAFTNLGLKKLCGKVLDTNTRAIQFYRALEYTQSRTPEQFTGPRYIVVEKQAIL